MNIGRPTTGAAFFFKTLPKGKPGAWKCQRIKWLYHFSAYRKFGPNLRFMGILLMFMATNYRHLL